MKTIKSKKGQTINKGAKFLLLLVLLCVFNTSNAQTDPYGTEIPPTNPSSEPCLPGATSWYLGGNILAATQIGTNGPIGPFPENTAGTCSNHPFVLKANNNKSVGSMPSGRVGIGSANPTTNLEVKDLLNTDIFAYSTNANGSAGLWAMNGTTNYGLRIDNSGVGHLSQHVANPLDMLNFNWNASLSLPKAQVWIGKRPTTGTHTDFDFAAPKIVANEMYVFISGTWADYVFDKNYKLPKLSEVEKFYKQNQHLPEIPTAKEVSENGISIGEMNTLLLKKVEELTLYLVQQEKVIESLKQKDEELTKMIRRD